MAAVRVVKPPWRAATRFPALVSAPGQEVGNVMTLDEAAYGRPPWLWRQPKGGAAGSWHGTNPLMAAIRLDKPPW